MRVEVTWVCTSGSSFVGRIVVDGSIGLQARHLLEIRAKGAAASWVKILASVSVAATEVTLASRLYLTGSAGGDLA